MNIIYTMIALSLMYSTPIIITGLGGLFSERSGIVNIALEGLMMIGGFSAAALIVFIEPYTSLAPWISILFGAIMGGVVAVLFAYITINLKADQVIAGTAINLLAAGITVYFCQIIFNQQRTRAFVRGFMKTTFDNVFGLNLAEVPVLGPIIFTNMYSTVFLAFILVFLTWFVVYRTTFGLRLRAVGEHPHAADSMGINVYRMRYTGVIISGVLAGLSGGIMVLTQDIQFTAGSIHGIGFIALASLIFGKWKPFGVLGAGLFFGFSQILGIYAKDISFLASFPNEFFKVLPYVLTIIALVVFSGKSVGPKAAGVIYDKGER